LLLVLALIMANSPKLLLLDEPTRGLDYEAKSKLISAVKQFTDSGTAVAIATHDVELVAELNANVIILSAGEIIAAGPARSVLTESVSFTPQISRTFAPINLLTIKEAVDAIKLAG
jgi:energy-coupling factor transport system ATP-binding protein